MGYVSACLSVITVLQCLKQAQWPEANPVLLLPGMVRKDGTPHEYASNSMAQLLSMPRDKLDNHLPKEVGLPLSLTNDQFFRVWESIPRLKVEGSQTSSKTLRVHIRRLNHGYTNNRLLYAPRFPKSQQESWFVLASGPNDQRLLALQRVTLSGRGGGDASVQLDIPAFDGDSVMVRVLSDGWRGVDEEKQVKWKRNHVVET